MSGMLTKVIGEKKEWRSMEARAHALPRDYRIVYDGMKKYLWRFTSGDGRDVVAVLTDVLGLFETGAAEGRHVLEVTGEDVAAFCDERLRATPTYTDRWRVSLNSDIAKLLGPIGRPG